MKYLIAALCLTLASTANAISYKVYKQDKAAGGNQWSYTKLYLTGVASGVRTVDPELQVRHQPRLVCMPTELILNMDNVIQILDDEIKLLENRLVISDDTQIDGFVMMGLVRTFPCQ